MSVLLNFLRRWSTMEITCDNALLFEEHMVGVRAIIDEDQQLHLNGLDRHSGRQDFARRYDALARAKGI